MQARKEDKIMKKIENKFIENKAMISKAGKGNSTVILYLDGNNQKVEKLISNNNFTTANAEITKNLQREIRNTVNECQRIIQKSERWKYVNYNPIAPTMRGQVKLHKEDTPIRTIINWRNTPGYKLA